jgi:thioredoxin 1
MKQMILGLSIMSGALLFLGCEKAAPVATKAADGAAEKIVSLMELDDTTFAAQTGQGVVLVDFWAPWCGPCRTQGPIVEKAAAQLGDTVKVAKVNVDQAPQTAQQFSIRSIPTLIVFKDGKMVRQFIGVTQADKLVAAVKVAQGSK